MRGLVVALTALLAGQPAFKSGVDVVRIPVTVMRGGEPAVDGLTAADFSVTEDGVTQSIAVFERDSMPLSLCIALDVSGSMSESASLAIKAIRNVTAELRSSDEIALMAFADGSHVLIPWSAPQAATQLAIAAEMGGSTSLHDATRAALDLLDSARNPRPVVLLITDGFDNSSRTRLTDIVKSRRQSEALVYAFAVVPDRAATRVERAGIDEPPSYPGGAPFIPLRGSPEISSVTVLVGDSGGTTYTMANTGDPARFARRFIDELRNQYTIGYTPAKPFDGKYRRVKVELKKRGYQIRHRGGYLALPSADRQ